MQIIPLLKKEDGSKLVEVKFTNWDQKKVSRLSGKGLSYAEREKFSYIVKVGEESSGQISLLNSDESVNKTITYYVNIKETEQKYLVTFYIKEPIENSITIKVDKEINPKPPKAKLFREFFIHLVKDTSVFATRDYETEKYKRLDKEFSVLENLDSPERKADIKRTIDTLNRRK